MEITITPKFPGLCAFVVVGFAVAGIYMGDFAHAFIAAALFIFDCMNFERAAQKEQSK